MRTCISAATRIPLPSLPAPACARQAGKWLASAYRVATVPASSTCRRAVAVHGHLLLVALFRAECVLLDQRFIAQQCTLLAPLLLLRAHPLPSPARPPAHPHTSPPESDFHPL